MPVINADPIEDPVVLKSPMILVVSALGFGFLFTLPVYWDYSFTQKALPYQGYVLYSNPHYRGHTVDHYDLTVQFQPPQQAVRKAAIQTDGEHKTGDIIPIAYDPHPGGDCRELKPKMSFWADVFPVFLIRCAIAAVATLLFEFKAWRRRLQS